MSDTQQQEVAIDLCDSILAGEGLMTYRELRSELDRLRPETAAWKPIETAPKTGRGIILHCKRAGVVTGGGWDMQEFHKRPKPYWTHDKEAIYGRTFVREDQPTHWMPYPEPPEDKP